MPAPSSATIQDIEANELRRQNAMLTADVSSLGGLLHDELIYVHSAGRFESKPEHLTAIASGKVVYLAFERWGITHIAVGDTGVLTGGRIKINVVFDGVDKLIDIAFLSVWHHDAEAGWRMLSWQSTPIPA